MPTVAVKVVAGDASEIVTGGMAVVALRGPMLGGQIVNPYLAVDQGLIAAEPLYVNIAMAAGLAVTATTAKLMPGQAFEIPAGETTSVSVNAATSGHLFSAFAIRAEVPYPPIPTPGTFPPAGPTGVTQTIPSYLYKEYDDDEDLQAFVASYNAMAQEYVDSFNGIELPIYTSPSIVGPLLDWVALGLYGIARPSLSSGRNRNLGPFNTYVLNSIPFNKQEIVGPQNVTIVTDDIFKRVITWNFFKGDGKYFDVRWLKRRVMRFLLGVDGVNFDVDQTYQVSVTFGVGNQVNITLLTGVRRLTGGALLNHFIPNTMGFNVARTTFEPLTPLPNAEILKEAIDTGVLQLPFQYVYVVAI